MALMQKSFLTSETSGRKCVLLCHVGILSIFLETVDIVSRFEVIAAVVMKSTTFWVITPFSLTKFNGRLGGTYRFRLQGRRIRRARYPREGGSDMFYRNDFDFQRTTRCSRIPEYSNLQKRRAILPKKAREKKPVVMFIILSSVHCLGGTG
jgi:hypothetical protein